MSRGLFIVVVTLVAAGGPWKADASLPLYAGLSTPFTAADGCGDCWWCMRDNAQGHLYFDEALYAPFSGTTSHSCMYGWGCLAHHGGCGGSAQSTQEVPKTALDDAAHTYLVALIDGVARGEEGAAARLLMEFGDRVTWNAERGAVQVAGCRADVVLAHLPGTYFPSGALATLAE